MVAALFEFDDGAAGVAALVFVGLGGGEEGEEVGVLGAFVAAVGGGVAGSADFGVAGGAEAGFAVDVRGGDPGAAVGGGAVDAVGGGVFEVFLVPLLFSGVGEEFVDVLEGDVVGGAASGWEC